MKCFLHTLSQKIKNRGYNENKNKTKKNIFLFDLYLKKLTCLAKNAFLVIFLELIYYMIKILLTELSLAQNKNMNEIGGQ